jgi:hypothetical protein
MRNAELNLARERAVLEDLELDVAREASEALRAVNANYHLAQSHFNRWVASNKEVEVLTLRVEEGVERLDLVLEAQRRRAQSQIDYYGAVVEYNQSISLLHNRKGSIAEYSGVAFAEGPWPDKAYWDSMGHARRRDAGTYLNYGWTRPRVISQGPVGQGYGGVYSTDGQMYVENYGEEIPVPQPTPAGSSNGRPMNGGPASGGMPMSEPTPAGPGVTTFESLRLMPADNASAGGDQWRRAVGSGVIPDAARGAGGGNSHSGAGHDQVRPVSFDWEGVNVPAPSGS